MMIRTLSIAALALLVTLPTAVVAQEEKPIVLPIKRLTADTALRMAQATLEACRKEGVNVTVTVIDRGGHPQVVLRDTLAMDITIGISRDKAYTAMSFNAPTGTLAERLVGNVARIATLDHVVPVAGGLPIAAGSTILGAIGVSGAPASETDEKCAQAGLDAVITDLEMAM